MIGAISSVIILGVADRAIQIWIFGRALRFGRRHLPLLADTAKLAVQRSRSGGADPRRQAAAGWIAPDPDIVGLRRCFHSGLCGFVKLFGVAEPDEMQFLMRALLSPVQVIGRRLGRQGGQE